MSPLRTPLYAGLLVDNVRHDALEFSASGLSLSLSVVAEAGLQHLRRGEECPVTLCVGGAGWQEVYDVVLRLAACGPAHIGFAFVLLPPPARRVLERHEPSRGEAEAWPDEDGPGGLFADVDPAPFAFARLAEPGTASRRFILSISEAVFALTRLRKQASPPAESTREGAPPEPSRPEDAHALSASTVLVWATALLAVLFVILMAYG